MPLGHPLTYQKKIICLFVTLMKLEPFFSQFLGFMQILVRSRVLCVHMCLTAYDFIFYFLFL